MSEKRKNPLDLKSLIIKTENEPDSILIQDLSVGNIVAIRTQYSMYVLKVLNPEERKIEITGNGQYFNEPTVTCVRGSRLTEIGTAIKIGWIAVGHRLELALGNVLLSATQRVSVNGVQVLPVTDEADN